MYEQHGLGCFYLSGTQTSLWSLIVNDFISKALTMVSFVVKTVNRCGRPFSESGGFFDQMGENKRTKIRQGNIVRTVPFKVPFLGHLLHFHAYQWKIHKSFSEVFKKANG